MPLLVLLLPPASSSVLERVAGIRLRSGGSETDVLFVSDALGVEAPWFRELRVPAGVWRGSESLVGCERVEESMVATVVLIQGRL